MKLFVFDMDGTLVNGRTILFLGEGLGFYKEARDILDSGSKGVEKTRMLARYLAGVELEKIIETAGRMPLMKGAEEVIEQLREMGHRTAIVTDSYEVVAEHFRKRLGMDRAVGNRLVVKEGRATGEIEMPSNCPTREECGHPSICKGRVLRELAREFGIPLRDTIAIGDNRVDICMMKAAGLGIAFDPKVKELEEAADVVIWDDDLRLILGNINIK